jgi:hypothetical protein
MGEVWKWERKNYKVQTEWIFNCNLQ